MHSTKKLAALAAMTSVAAADVFVHYMAQTLEGDHALQDVTRARALGVSAFALNVGRPDQEWAQSAIAQLFAAASGTDFKIFFSLDFNGTPDPYAFSSLVNQYSSHPNYYTSGPNSAPLLSTFWGHHLGPDAWVQYLASLQHDHYVVPNFEQADGYYSNPDGFWSAWSDVLDGTFTWEQAWPEASDTHSNVTSELDQELLRVAHSHGKAYMMGLSSLQYKHLPDDQHWFRSGDIVFPERMTQILSLPDRPEFVQIQTWNDAGESHYIGHLWGEGIPPEIQAYANQAEHPHEGWQALVASFIAAFNSGADASGMRPQNGAEFAGAMWHHEFLTSSPCTSDDLGEPRGQGAARDAVNWAVVVGEGSAAQSVQVLSGGEVIAEDPLSPGLNYKSVPGAREGQQIVRLLDGAGNVVAEGGQSTKGIAQNAGGICNHNFQVAEII